jgi:hypothetical protein
VSFLDPPNTAGAAAKWRLFEHGARSRLSSQSSQHASVPSVNSRMLTDRLSQRIQEKQR